MKFDKNITFPYPVLGLHGSPLYWPDFTYEITDSEDGKDYVFSIVIDISKIPIKSYIKTRDAEFVCEVDCKRTYYRQCLTSTTPNFNFVIPKNAVGGEMKIMLTIDAVRPIQNYSTGTWAPHVYMDYRFDLEQGDIMAYVGSVKIHLDIMSDEYKAVGSFLHFVKGQPESAIAYDLDGQDIKVTLPYEMFENYTQHLKGNRFKPVVISSVVNEALIYALTQYHNHEDARWARLLSSSSVLADYDFEGEIDVLTAIEMAHAILEQPHSRLFASLVDIMENDDDE